MGWSGRRVKSSTEQPASPAGAASPMVSATPAGSSANAFSRSAETGSVVAAAMAAACASASSRVTAPSGRPSVAAKPPLVVASAAKPSEASSRADPASHGFGSSSGPGPSWRARKTRARSAWFWTAPSAAIVMASLYGPSRQPPADLRGAAGMLAGRGRHGQQPGQGRSLVADLRDRGRLVADPAQRRAEREQGGAGGACGVEHGAVGAGVQAESKRVQPGQPAAEQVL